LPLWRGPLELLQQLHWWLIRPWRWPRRPPQGRPALPWQLTLPACWLNSYRPAEVSWWWALGVRSWSQLAPYSPDSLAGALHAKRRQHWPDQCRPALQLLADIIAARLAFLISGGTGAGKTTMLAATIGAVADRERIVCVEDAAELAPKHPHFVRLVARSANVEGAGEITLRQLVRQALRMRPDRIIVGEVRGAEVVDLLAALNTGHDGGAGTVHANSPAEVPARLEALAALDGLDRAALHSQLAAAVQVVLHVSRGPHGRRLSEIAVLQRDVEGWVRALPVWHVERGLQQGAEQLRQLINDRCGR
jgi:hypothetical protein